jgi:hypothetical protein
MKSSIVVKNSIFHLHTLSEPRRGINDDDLISFHDFNVERPDFSITLTFV